MNPKSFLTGATSAAILISAALFTPGCGTPTQRDLMREDANAGERPVAMKLILSFGRSVPSNTRTSITTPT